MMLETDWCENLFKELPYSPEKQYLDLCQRIVNDGKWITNSRTGKRCRTVINADFEYDVSYGKLPVLTTKKVAWKPAIAEMLGYLRGYTNAQQFADLGCNTWFENANRNEGWLKNPHRKGENDIGRSYGAQIRDWRNPDNKPIDQLRKVVDNLSKSIDDRREIITFWNPGEMDRIALPACMHTHTFSILDGDLYLTSYQRSYDAPLGGPFNAIQVAWLLLVIAQITGLNAAKAFHKVVNAHIYEDQLDIMSEVQLKREPRQSPKLVMNRAIKTLEDLETWVTPNDFELTNYNPHPAIKYPFSV